MRMRPEPIAYKLVSGDERRKNRTALSELDIAAADRAKYILRLTAYDYYVGPDPDTFNYPPPGEGPIWVFGTIVKGLEVYIKLQIGAYGAPPVCLSFHVAERTMTYPFRS
ncbi:hypothetical protein BXP70_27345 [Hymenobacter crusticola]|uniref:Toxin n=2 Tax=Hymenobacter crusticola TaxID=1770526 RepID=A0A243W5N2_9BACT|nr:hypothetical protein BXP70_27345 [Hymenobacter crusticola]